MKIEAIEAVAEFERVAIKSDEEYVKRGLFRARVPGGWIVRSSNSSDNDITTFFVPDPGHSWGAVRNDLLSDNFLEHLKSRQSERITVEVELVSGSVLKGWMRLGLAHDYVNINPDGQNTPAHTVPIAHIARLRIIDEREWTVEEKKARNIP